MRTLLATACGACLALASSSAAAGDKLYRYVDAEGVTVLTNVPPSQPKRAHRVAQEGELTRVSSPREFLPSSKGSADFDAHIEQACALYRIPPALVRAIMAAESAFNPKAVSAKGAQGLMQLMPATAAEMFVSDAFDPKQSIHGGVRYLRALANLFNGDMVRIVAAYNAGPDAVKNADGIPQIAETQDYVKRVLRLYFSYKSEPSKSEPNKSEPNKP